MLSLANGIPISVRRRFRTGCGCAETRILSPSPCRQSFLLRVRYPSNRPPGDSVSLGAHQRRTRGGCERDGGSGASVPGAVANAIGSKAGQRTAAAIPGSAAKAVHTDHQKVIDDDDDDDGPPPDSFIPPWNSRCSLSDRPEVCSRPGWVRVRVRDGWVVMRGSGVWAPSVPEPNARTRRARVPPVGTNHHHHHLTVSKWERRIPRIVEVCVA